MRIFSIGGSSANRDPMVDIERLLIDYAWNEIADKSIFDKLFKNKRYTLEVNWSYLDITHRLNSFKLRNQFQNVDPCNNNDANQSQSVNTISSTGGKKQKISMAEKLRNKVLQRDLCLFRTEFTNSSNEPQTFTFKTERKTTSRCDINIQKGFRIGANVDVRVSIPTNPASIAAAATNTEGIDTCRVTGGLSGELHITKATGQTIEENLTWGVDSQVKVESMSRVVAALMIREEELTADFSICTQMQATHSVIPVYIREKKTGRLLEMLEIPSDNLSEILTEDAGFEKLNEFGNGVKCLTKGCVRAVYGAEQVIRVDSYKGVELVNENKIDDICEWGDMKKGILVSEKD